MGFFNKPNQQTNIQTNATIISSGTTVKGDISSRCALHIDGTHNGTISSKQTVTIGDQGNVDGEISAKTLSITGTFKGTADCDQIVILAGGNVKGKVISAHLSIDHNCQFEGESVKRSNSNLPNGVTNGA